MRCVAPDARRAIDVYKRQVLTHQFILHEIWGTATKSDLASLRVFMGTLRKKIESDPAHRCV